MVVYGEGRKLLNFSRKLSLGACLLIYGYLFASIGMRFAQIEVKSVIAHIVHGFLIEPTAKTPLPLRGQPVAFQLMPPKDLELKLTPISIKN